MVFRWLKREKNVCSSCEITLSKLTTRVTKLESESLDHYTAAEAIRDKVLRKIQFKKAKEEPEEEEDKPQNTYSKMLLPSK